MGKFRGLMVPIILIMIILPVFFSCKIESVEESGNEPVGPNENVTYDIDVNGVPRFVFENYIELDKIRLISKFRSGVGHSYSDDFESCRSMKHYFQPKADVNWASVKIFSPINGTIIKISQDHDGAQIRVKSKEYPAFFFILFHVNLSNSLQKDDEVKEGQLLGSHISQQTMSDIAVGVNTPGGWKLISFLEVVSDALFQEFQNRGMITRNGGIITKQARDAAPLTCDSEEFKNSGSLENWFIFN